MTASFREQAEINGYDASQVDFFERLKKDYSEFNFRFGRKFAFRPKKTVIFGPLEDFSELLALHEVSHAVLGHTTFKTDVERLKMESAAWDKARELAKKYKIEINEELIQVQLDTYRDWLHQKSRCPKCGLTRFETRNGLYYCPRCDIL